MQKNTFNAFSAALDLSSAEKSQKQVRDGIQQVATAMAKREAQFDQKRNSVEKDIRRGARLTEHRFTI